MWVNAFERPRGRRSRLVTRARTTIGNLLVPTACLALIVNVGGSG
jgi:hypothetical protein